MEVDLLGTHYPLVSYSYLCYGQAEALNRHLALMVYTAFTTSNRSLPSNMTVTDPCLPPQSSLTRNLSSLLESPCAQFNDQQFMRLVTADTNLEVAFIPGDPSQCPEAVGQAFEPDSCKHTFVQPPEEKICLEPSEIPAPSNQTYLAMSTYWYLLSALDLNTGDADAPFSVPLSKFDSAISHVCTTGLASLQKEIPGFDTARKACFQATFMRSLLTKGYHFNSESWNNISFVKRLGDPPAEVGWSLGHAIIKANQQFDGIPAQHCISVVVFVAMLILSGLLLLVSIVCAVKTRRGAAQDTPYEGLA